MSGRLWFAAHKMESCLARDAESGCSCGIAHARMVSICVEGCPAAVFSVRRAVVCHAAGCAHVVCSVC